MNFCRRFIEGFSDVARPLSSLTGKGGWKWGAAQEQAFAELKRRITSAPLLVMPRACGKFRLEADSSNYATGGILSQQQEDNTWRPVAFISHALNETERNYEIYDKEMLAIMHALSEYRQYLLGAAEEFEIWTDHKNLEYFRKPQKLNRRQARWVAELQEFHFTLHHKPGKAMQKADFLSRRAGHEKGERDNENLILLKPEFFRAHYHDVRAESDDIMRRIKRAAKNRDKLVERALVNKEKDWEELDGHIVTWKHRFYVPRDKRLREDIIRLHHSTRLAGHPGRYKTQELITRNYWWPRLQTDIRSYIDGCQTCQRTKIRRKAPPAPLSPNAIPTRPWQIVTVDLLGPLPMSHGFDMILVFTDRLTKAVKFQAANGEINSLGFAKHYRDRVFRDHGLSELLIHDRGTQFASQFTKDLCKLLGIKQNISTAYHPQTNGRRNE